MEKNYWTKHRKTILFYFLFFFTFYELIIFILLGWITSMNDETFRLDNFWASINNGWTLDAGINSSIMIILTIIYLLLAALLIHVKYFEPNFVHKAKGSEQGGAQWILDEENKRNETYQTNTFNKLYPSSKVVREPGWIIRAKYAKNETIFNTRNNTQALCLGATGSGKTQKIIIPSALYNASLEASKKPCMIFTDPKGELYETLADTLTNKGYEILALNIREPKFSDGWNPLAIAYKYYYDSITYCDNNLKIINDLDDKERKKMVYLFLCYSHQITDCQECSQNLSEKSPIYILQKKYWLYDLTFVNKIVNASILELRAAAYEEVEDLVTTLFPMNKNDSNPVWTQNAGRMVAAVIYALLELLDDDLNNFPLEKFNMATVSVILSNQEKLIKWFKQLAIVSPNSKAYITASLIINSAEVTRQGVFSNIGPALKIFEDLGIQNIICKNEIDLFDFTTKPKALFLIIPDEKINRHILGSLFISQIYKANVFVANQNKGKLPRQVQFYLDEFGNMPTIPNFSSFITVSRSRNMFFLLVLQDFKQLTGKYGEEDGKIIRSNCNLNIYIQTNDYDTAEAYSKIIGDYTAISSSIEKKYKKTIEKNGNSSQIAIPLIKAADLMRIKDPYGIVMFSKENPAKVYMEYSYKCLDFNLKKTNIAKHKKINIINFYENHFFNLSDYDLQVRIK